MPDKQVRPDRIIVYSGRNPRIEESLLLEGKGEKERPLGNPGVFPNVSGIADDFIDESFEQNDGEFSTQNIWMFGGTGELSISDERALDGSYSARFGNFGSGLSSFYTAAGVSDTSVVSFSYFKTDWGADALYFYIDDEKIFTADSTTSRWSSSYSIIDPGIYTLKWENSRFTYCHDNEYYYIDNIRVHEIGALVSDDFENNDGTFSETFDWI